MKEQIMEVARLTIRPEIQVRAFIRREVVDEYADGMMAKAQFPSLDAFYDGENYFLADGFHRFKAAQKAGVETMAVRVHEGGLREATLFAVGANALHGIRRTKADKRKAVKTLLMDDEWKGWSDGEIAKQCMVSQTFVSKVRREMAQDGAEFPEERKGADGKTRNTKNIGKKSAAADQPSQELGNPPGSEGVEEFSGPNATANVTLGGHGGERRAADHAR